MVTPQHPAQKRLTCRRDWGPGPLLATQLLLPVALSAPLSFLSALNLPCFLNCFYFAVCCWSSPFLQTHEGPGGVWDYVPQAWNKRQSKPQAHKLNPREGPNFLFYSNLRSIFLFLHSWLIAYLHWQYSHVLLLCAWLVRPSRPSGDLIDRIHRRWWGNHDLLEAHHG